ncbi:MAG: hypothetical protein OXL37_14860 [Chloroflexota bacterium]|nr:hypothetical protein [Chloroflexota bacterium]MDE2961681.1 hypothetical protein [Chloroflexota bacterium]
MTFVRQIAKFISQREDAAVEALGYILSRSETARLGLANMLRDGDADVGVIAKIETQVSGEDRTRPDLSVIDEQGTERVLIEAKLSAGLTENQPNGYLSRLPKDRQSALLFVVPTERLEKLWSDVYRSASSEHELAFHPATPGVKSAVIVGSGRRLMMVSWSDLIVLHMVGTMSYAEDHLTLYNIVQLSDLIDG